MPPQRRKSGLWEYSKDKTTGAFQLIEEEENGGNLFINRDSRDIKQLQSMDFVGF